MVSKPGLSPSEIGNLKHILAVSRSYYAKILPLYRESLERRRFRCRKVKNLKGLRVKICPSPYVTATDVSPRVVAPSTPPVLQAFPIPKISTNPLKRPAFPVESTIEPPSKKSRKWTSASAIGVRSLNPTPILTRLQTSLTLPSNLALKKGRWFIIKQRGLVSLDKPPKDLLTIRVPPRLKIIHPPK